MITNTNLRVSENGIYFVRKLSISSAKYLKLYTWKQQKLLKFKDKDFILFNLTVETYLPPKNCLYLNAFCMTLLKSTPHSAV